MGAQHATDNGHFETLAELVKQPFGRPIPLRERPLNADSCLVFSTVPSFGWKARQRLEPKPEYGRDLLGYRLEVLGGDRRQLRLDRWSGCRVRNRHF
jgi:hypothetical protein